MPTHRQWIVQVPTSTQGNGSSDTETHQKAFPLSPFYNGELNDDNNVRAQYNDIVMAANNDGVTSDGGHTFGEISLNYAGAPNFDEVKVGGGGLPGSPYAPNIASPTDGVNPQSIPESGVEATQKAKGQGDPFPGDGLASPSNTSRVLSSYTTLGSLSFGKSTPNV